MCMLCACANALGLPVTDSSSVKMVEPVGHTQPEPESEPGAGTSLRCSDSSKSNPNMLLEALKACKR